MFKMHIPLLHLPTSSSPCQVRQNVLLIFQPTRTYILVYSHSCEAQDSFCIWLHSIHDWHIHYAKWREFLKIASDTNVFMYVSIIVAASLFDYLQGPIQAYEFQLTTGLIFSLPVLAGFTALVLYMVMLGIALLDWFIDFQRRLVVDLTTLIHLFSRSIFSHCWLHGGWMYGYSDSVWMNWIIVISLHIIKGFIQPGPWERVYTPYFSKGVGLQ